MKSKVKIFDSAKKFKWTAERYGEEKWPKAGSAGAGVTKVIFGHGVTKTHRENLKKKTKKIIPKNLSIRQFWLIFSKTRAPHPAEIL